LIFYNQNEPSTPNITRLAGVVSKEGPIQQMLELIENRRFVSKKVLLQSFRKHNPEKLIGQAIYCGLISETDEGEFFYYLAENGCKVLRAIKAMN
jgi:hypothetical protein